MLAYPVCKQLNPELIVFNSSLYGVSPPEGPTSIRRSCRKFLRAVVDQFRTLMGVRHQILHDWNGQVQSVTLEHGMKLWNHRSLACYWKFEIQFASGGSTGYSGGCRWTSYNWMSYTQLGYQTCSFRAIFGHG